MQYIKRFLVILAFVAMPGAAWAQAGAGDIFTVALVPVEATASSSEEARLLAQDSGRRQALQILMRRLTLESDWPYLPQPGISELLDMQVGFEVNNERFSTQAGVANRYLAEITYSFRRDRVRALLRSQGIAFSESQAATALVVPILERGGAYALWGEENTWAGSWYEQDLTHELVPMILPLGDLSDTTIVTVDDVIQGNWEALGYLASRYNVDRVFIAHAVIVGDQQNSRLYARMTEITADGIGRVYETQVSGVDESLGGTLGGLGDRAITLLSAQFQEGWKAQTLVNYDVQHRIQATARFGSLSEWVRIRDALQNSAMVNDYSAWAMSSGGAEVAVTFVGSPQQLGITLRQRGVALNGSRGLWELALRDSEYDSRDDLSMAALPPVETVQAQARQNPNAPTLSEEDLQSIFESSEPPATMQPVED